MYMYIYIFSEATPELPELTPTLAATAATSTAQQKIIELRSWIFSANAHSMGAPGDIDRYGAGLRAAAQAYEVVRIKAADNPGGLAGSLEHTVGGRKSVKALAIALRDAVVKRAVCSLAGFNDSESFVIAINTAFDGGLLKNDELKSQLLNSYHHVWPHGGTKER